MSNTSSPSRSTCSVSVVAKGEPGSAKAIACAMLASRSSPSVKSIGSVEEVAVLAVGVDGFDSLDFSDEGSNGSVKTTLIGQRWREFDHCHRMVVC